MSAFDVPDSRAVTFGASALARALIRGTRVLG